MSVTPILAKTVSVSAMSISNSCAGSQPWALRTSQTFLWASSRVSGVTTFERG